MKELLEKAAIVIFYVFAAVLLIWTASNTLDLLAIVTGRDSLIPVFGLVLFEGGMLAWLLYFLFGAKGIWQRMFAVVGSLVDLVLLVGGVGIHLWIKVEPDKWESPAIWIIVVATLVNVVLAWSAHITDPHSIQQIRFRSAQDKTMDLAYKKFEEKRAETANTIADNIAQTMIEQAHGELTHRYAPSQPAPLMTLASTAPAATVAEPSGGNGTQPKNQ